MAKQATIQFYRGPASGLPALEDGEPGWTTDTHKLYVGQDGVNHLVAGGSASLADGDYGDITVSSSGTVFTVDDGVIDTDKLGGDITTAGKALLDDANAAAQRTTLGLGSAAVEDASAFDAAGTASSAVSTHEGLSDPHPQYLTSTEGDAAYQPLDGDLTAIAALSGTNTIYYRSAADTWTAVTIGSGLSFSGGTLSATAVGLTDGDKGDITVSSTGTVWTIDNSAVTYAKIQNVSATDKLLGRSTAGAGVIEEIACTAAGRALLDDADAAAQLATLGAQAQDDFLDDIAALSDPNNPYFLGWDDLGNNIGWMEFDSGDFNISSGVVSIANPAPGAASQTDQETGTSTATFVSPGRQQYHPSAAKCWGIITLSGGTPTLAASFNLTSVTDDGDGKFTFTIATDFSTTNYSVVGMPEADASGTVIGFRARNGGKAVGSVALDSIAFSGSFGFADPASLSFAAWGDQ